MVDGAANLNAVRTGVAPAVSALTTTVKGGGDGGGGEGGGDGGGGEGGGNGGGGEGAAILTIATSGG